MIQMAKRLNRYGDKATYRQNSRDDLSLLEDKSADLVLSHITLQHIRPDLAERYIRQFFRIVKPGGLIIFQLPSHLTEEYPRSDMVDEPLPTHACKATISIKSAVPLRASVSEQTTIEVAVRNDSLQESSQSRQFPLTLANRWLSADGTSLLVPDDGRAPLPRHLPASEDVRLALTVTAPSAPGQYRLVLDVVQEGVRRFQEVNGPPLSVPTEVSNVQSSRSAPESEPGDRYPFAELMGRRYAPARDFEMHGIPIGRVLGILEECGGQLLALDEHVTEWWSYGYYIQKRPLGSAVTQT